MRVPFEPTAFPSAGRTHLLYELHVRNAGSAPVTLSRVEVLDAHRLKDEPIAVFEGEALNAVLRSGDEPADASARDLPAGEEAVVFVGVALDQAERVPSALVHRVRSGETMSEGAAVGTQHTELKVLGPPTRGAGWLASDAPSNDADNHHRRGLVEIDGKRVISRRYAIDWKRQDGGSSYSGDPLDPRSYHAYGAELVAVGDGRVVIARDGLPDNTPRHNGVFRPAIPITMETVPGNMVVLDLGGGQFAHYYHLQPGSVSVSVGDTVRRGQAIGRIGDSGDAREPHLHFEMTTDGRPLVGEGVPYVIDAYSVAGGADGVIGPRERELPLDDMIVDFGERPFMDGR
jgi:murein DD-endopeptidase MepM/ murein hydrolase activator NlpD